MVHYSINLTDSNKILIVGNSFCTPSLNVPNPWPYQLQLNGIYCEGATLDYQAELIIDLEKDRYDKLIWVVGQDLRADPRGDGTFILPYSWGDKDKWDKRSKDIWFKFYTRRSWYKRISLLSIMSVLHHVKNKDLLIVPLFKSSIVNHPAIFKNSSIWREYFGDYRNLYPDGTGHVGQEGHDKFSVKIRTKLEELDWI